MNQERDINNGNKRDGHPYGRDPGQMGAMMRLSVKIKLGGAFGLVVALTMTVGAVGYLKLATLNETVDRVLSQRVKLMQMGDETKARVLQVIRAEKNAMLSSSDADTSKFGALAKDEAAKAMQVMADAIKLSDPDTRVYFENVQKVASQSIDATARTLQYAIANSESKAHDIAVQTGQPAYEAANSVLRDLGDSILAAKPANVSQADVESIRKTQHLVDQAWSGLLAGIAAQSSTEADKFGIDHAALIEKLQGQSAGLSTLKSHQPDLAVDPVIAALAQYLQEDAKLTKLAVEAGTQRASDFSTGPGVQKIRSELWARVDDLVNYLKTKLSEDQAGAVATYQDARTLLIVIIATSILVAAGAGTWIAFSISRGLGKAVGLADAVAMGDLSQKIEVKSDDEIGDLVKALNGMVGNLNTTAKVADAIASGDLTVDAKRLSDQDTLGMALERMLGKLRQIVNDAVAASSNVASGSEELSASATQLSQGATEQASATEEASASMEEMASNVKQTADNASQTEKIARQSSLDAEASGVAVSKAVQAMETIAQKITIVQEIARQTDLLALNAAVEAARAGERGRGVAVVASEVRKLAERSQTAAQEISALSVDTVKSARDAGSMLAKLVPDIRRTAELVEEITAACREQDIGATQVNQAIQQLDKVTQQNASASEQVSSTSEELSSQAEQLQTTIAFFKTDASSRVEPVSSNRTDHHVAALRSKASDMRRTVPAKKAPVAAPKPKRAAAGGFALAMDAGEDALDDEFHHA